MKRLVIAAVFSVMAFPAAAQECTDEAAEELTDELFMIIEANPDIADNIDQYIAEVEAHYGGEPTDEETCEALEMLLDMVEGDM